MTAKEKENLLIRIHERQNMMAEDVKEMKNEVKQINKWRFGIIGSLFLSLFGVVK